MIVIPATPVDIPALAEIAARSYREAFSDILERDVIKSRDIDFFMDRFASTWDRMLVAFDGSEPIGFLLRTAEHIDMLFMHPDAQGRGGGSLLLKEAEAYGVNSLECFRDNQNARHFYERHGWRIAREYEREFAGRNRSFVLYEKD